MDDGPARELIYQKNKKDPAIRGPMAALNLQKLLIADGNGSCKSKQQEQDLPACTPVPSSGRRCCHRLRVSLEGF
jgi:hypothetical protein